MLDELTDAQVRCCWVGDGPIGDADGWVRSTPRDHRATCRPRSSPRTYRSHELLAALGGGGAHFFDALLPSGSGCRRSRRSTSTALWELVWAAWCSSDTFAPVRSLAASGRSPKAQPAYRQHPSDRLAGGGWSGRALGAYAPGSQPPRRRVAGHWSQRSPPMRVRAHGLEHLRPAGPLRRGHPRQRAHRERRRRVRSRLPGAAVSRRARPVSPRILRRGSGRGPVRPNRRRGPAAQASINANRPNQAPWCSPLPTLPTRTAPRCPGLIAKGIDPGARRVRSWSWSAENSTFYVERGGRTLLSFTDDSGRAGPGRHSLSLGRSPGAARQADRGAGRRGARLRFGHGESRLCRTRASR